MLRATVAATLYSSTPPKSLKKENNQLQHPPTDFVHSLRSHSLRLFTPQSLSPSAGYVPPQVILLLAVSALKFDVVTLVREFIEDASLEDVTAYEKIIEIYSLHIIAILGAWEDARGFLRYEKELLYLRKSSRYESLRWNYIPTDYRINSAYFKSWK